MVVDDNPANLELLEDMILQEGDEVRSSPRARLALSAAMNFPLDLILLDIKQGNASPSNQQRQSHGETAWIIG